jgi:hypothetical protein
MTGAQHPMTGEESVQALSPARDDENVTPTRDSYSWEQCRAPRNISTDF